MQQKKLSDLKTKPEEEEEISYEWAGGVITKLSKMESRKIFSKWKKKKKRICAICGNERELTHRRISGGVRSLICSDCADEYVKSAEKVKIEYGLEAGQ